MLKAIIIFSQGYNLNDFTSQIWQYHCSLWKTNNNYKILKANLFWKIIIICFVNVEIDQKVQYLLLEPSFVWRWCLLFCNGFFLVGIKFSAKIVLSGLQFHNNMSFQNYTSWRNNMLPFFFCSLVSNSCFLLSRYPCSNVSITYTKVIISHMDQLLLTNLEFGQHFNYLNHGATTHLQIWKVLGSEKCTWCWFSLMSNVFFASQNSTLSAPIAKLY
jgi:hypothetical protein